MTGIIYARYSSDNQREESIDGQIRECKEFAEKNDIRIIDTYIDRALSAKTDNRPSFQQMIKDSSKGLFDVIIVWKLDRFARNRYDSAHYKNILKKNGVKVVSATEAISSGAEGILLESMLEGYAEYYSAELAEKINRGLTENALKCKYNGGSVAFGYMIDDEQHFKINPTLAPVVLNIFNDYISGKTQKEIRDELNNKGLKNANGREFTINNISKILTNRRYVGNYIYKDVVIENGIPAIVPNDVFDKVQEMIAVNKRAPSRHKAVDDYLLTTKLYCGKCKSFMVGESGNARGRRYSYYKCVNTKRNKTCDKKAVKKDWIEDIVIYQVMKFINDDSLIEMLVNKILSIQGKKSPMLKSLKKQLAQTDTAIENMLNAIEQGIITKSTKKRLDELESTKENLETEIAKENISHPLLTKEFLYSWFDGFKNFDVNKLENRKMLIDTFVNSVVLYDDRIDFYFNFKDNVKSLTLSELNAVSDLSSSSPPKKAALRAAFYIFCVPIHITQKDIQQQAVLPAAAASAANTAAGKATASAHKGTGFAAGLRNHTVVGCPQGIPQHTIKKHIAPHIGPVIPPRRRYGDGLELLDPLVADAKGVSIGQNIIEILRILLHQRLQLLFLRRYQKAAKALDLRQGFGALIRAPQHTASGDQPQRQTQGARQHSIENTRLQSQRIVQRPVAEIGAAGCAQRQQYKGQQLQINTGFVKKATAALRTVQVCPYGTHRFIKMVF